MNNDIFNHIVERLLRNADDALKEFDQNKDDEFYQGRRLAYWEVLDTLKSELMVADYDLKACGLDRDVDAKYMGLHKKEF